MKKGIYFLIFLALVIVLISFISAQENQTTAMQEAKEQVKCIFLNSNSEQRCISYYNGRTIECSGIESCIVEVSGVQGIKIYWKTSCGGYYETIIDGQNDEISFKCEQLSQLQPVPQPASQPTQYPTTTQTQTCMDSDGEDYYKKSYVKTVSGEIWDSCYSDVQLEEKVCTDGKYNTIIYTCPSACKDGACVKQESWTGYIHIEVVENICEPCTSSSQEKPCRCESIKLYNAKVSLYDSTGNLINSGDTSSGAVEFSGLKEGKYLLNLYADGYNTISLKKTGTEQGKIKVSVQDRQTRNILYNSKVSIYGSSGNFINSADTSSGSAVFYNLKEGAYIAIATSANYNQNKVEFKIIGSESDYLIINLEKNQEQITPEPSIYWYRNAYWQCYDGYEEKSGGETSCKPAEVWKNYAEDACKNHCSKETNKCGVNSFSVYNECPGSIIIEPSVCGNGICESGEGERCEVEAIACEEGKKCEARPKTAKCYYVCEEDCKKIEIIYARLEEKFKLQMSQEIGFSDYTPLKIKFNDFFLPKCIEEVIGEAKPVIRETQKAVVEKYNPLTGEVIFPITGRATEESAVSGGVVPSVASILCKEGEPYAVLQIKLGNTEVKKEYTEVVKMKLGEKKKFSDIYSHIFVISFLDFDMASKSGVFLVSKNVADFTCPDNCKCDLAGNVTECKKIEKCPKKTMLCPDGICKEKCEITNITIECKFGCFYQDKCLPYGLRISGLYCSINNDMKTQQTENEACENNFECKTNVCIDGKCISSGLINKVIDFFRKLFG